MQNLHFRLTSVAQKRRCFKLLLSKDKQLTWFVEIYIEKESATSACKLKFKRENGQIRIKLVIAIAKCQRAMILPIHHFHIDHNAPCLAPKILYNHCFQFLLGITVIPREIQDNGYTKFEGGGG